LYFSPVLPGLLLLPVIYPPFLFDQVDRLVLPLLTFNFSLRKKLAPFSVLREFLHRRPSASMLLLYLFQIFLISPCFFYFYMCASHLGSFPVAVWKLSPFRF
jgi:hypothetical protein